MSPIPCEEFRARLERALRGHPASPGAQVLAWHEHLLGCAACRSLLETEEALETLLASLPDPALPPHLVTRVLARLEAHRGGRTDLDRLLDLDRVPVVPPDLAPRILAGLSAARRDQRADERLERLLDRVPPPRVPPELPARVLAGLEPARRPVVRFRLVRARRLAAAAVVLVLALVAWRVFAAKGAVEPDTPSAEEPVDAELIAALDVLQRWDILMSDDPNLQLVSIGPLEEVLLEAAEFEETPAADDVPASDEGGDTEEGG
jgi:hypothetical protein